jgi:hypothetical protein
MELTRTLTLLLLLTLSASAQTPRIPPPESVNRNGLVGRWLVPGRSASNAHLDDSVLRHNGQPFGANIFGLFFSRFAAQYKSTCYTSLPYISPLSGATKATLSLWVYPTALPSIEAGAENAGLYYEDTGVVGYTRIAIFHLGTGAFIGVVRDTHSGSAFVITTSSTSWLNKWTHWVLTYNSLTDKMVLYANGVVVGQNSAPKGAIYSYNTLNRYIGAFVEPGVRKSCLNGVLADVRIYNVEWSSDTVKLAYRGLQ